MGRGFFFGKFPPIASATDNKSSPQGIKRSYVRLPAVTNAFPVTVLPVAPVAFLSKQSSKSLTANVVRYAHEF
jgi:hypothetical protein